MPAVTQARASSKSLSLPASLRGPGLALFCFYPSMFPSALVYLIQDAPFGPKKVASDSRKQKVPRGSFFFFF